MALNLIMTALCNHHGLVTQINNKFFPVKIRGNIDLFIYCSFYSVI